MRLFTGLALDAVPVRRIERILATLRPSAQLKWSPLTNLHLTSAFIGAWPEARLDELREALSQVDAPGPIAITVQGFGFFPNPHHPHSLFLSVKPDPGLTTLAHRIEDALSNLGCRREARAYTPHITLARIARENITELREQIASMNNQFPLETFAAEEFHLYESRSTGTGSVYGKLATFPLSKEVSE
ncbi:MAG TPA: RNA 2',3'-cyclic phosphodiesterase [Bryobacteraceae bacterium]|nr:RNA 2',3'-cyclic phosphodiesterase [Bryobacteraceae bacterium]